MLLPSTTSSLKCCTSCVRGVIAVNVVAIRLLVVSVLLCTHFGLLRVQDEVYLPASFMYYSPALNECMHALQPPP